MSINILKANKRILFSLLFISSLISALFYTGNNTWLFTASYILIVASLAIIFWQRFSDPIKISINGILISSVLLLIWFGIAVFFNQIKYLSLYNFFWVGSLIIVFLIFTFHSNKDQIWKNIWPGILLLVFIWALYGLVQYYYLHVPTNATFLNRNSLAALINLALIPVSGYFLLSSSDRPWKFLSNKILTFTLIILFLTTFIITSRGGSLSLILGFVILLTLLRKHTEKSQLYTLFIIVFISFLVAYLSQNFIQESSDGFAERMVTLNDTSKAGNSRFIMWESLIPLFKEMPWYGLGLGSLWVFWPPHRPANDSSAGFFAHNDYMQITLEAGYPGIILLVALFIFILLGFIKALKNSSADNKLHRVEIVSIFAALTTFAAHSFFTYNFYILPLLLIAGFYLGRFNQLVSLNSNSLKTFPALSNYFKPITFSISLFGIVIILSTYFITLSLSSYYNFKAKELMLQHKFQISNEYFLKAQKFAPLMDNPFFSHADMLRRGANSLIRAKKYSQSEALLTLAHNKLNTAEKLHPLRAQTYHIRGLIHELTQPEKAIAQFKKALKLDPRFLFSRIRLARLLHKENQLKLAMEVLYEGVNYSYRVDKVMLEYMTLFAQYSREAGVESFALHLETNIKKLTGENRLN